MPSADAQRTLLTAHPSTPCHAVRCLEVRTCIREVDVLSVEYSLEAELSQVRIPAQRGRRRADELWRHTCFEAFLITDDSPGYYELNFSPSGEWAAYRFSAYRTGMAPADGVGIPEISLRTGQDRVQLDVAIAIAAIREATAPQSGVKLRIAIAAVIEDRNGALSYWAQGHASGKPDFHHPEYFAAEIPS